MTSSEYILSRISGGYECAIVLGSGWDEVSSVIKKDVVVEYSEIPDYPVCTVQGHAGQMIFGRLAGKKVVLLKGRFHLYEGYGVDEVVKPIALLHDIGVKTVVLTNASGAVNASFCVGDVMIITDHINFTATNPLIGLRATKDRPIFVDMSTVYTPRLALKVAEVCEGLGMRYHTGVYLQTTGPMYETNAEVRAFRGMGADAVGMSTVPEATMAHYLGMDVIGLSLLSNMASGVTDQPLSHKEVLAVAHHNKKTLGRLIENIVKSI